MRRTNYLLLFSIGLFVTSFSVEYLEVTKCYGGFFMDALCPSGLTITVQGAVFGVSKCNLDARQCCPDPNDCVLNAEQTEQAYFRAIQRSCNGHRRCIDNLRADWTSARTCDALVPTTDYVTLFYTCSATGSTSPDFFPKTTVPSLISSLSTIFATEFPEGISSLATSRNETSGVFSGGTLAGIIVASASGFIFFVLLVIYCIRTREPGWAETFNEGIDDMKHKKDIKYLTSSDGSQLSSGDKEKKAMSSNEGMLNPGFTPERETPRYIRPTQPPPAVNHPYYIGAEVVKTPQQAIDMMDNEYEYKDEEDQYDVIDDVLSRFTPSTGSVKKKSFRTLSVPVPGITSTDLKNSVRKTTSHTGIEKVSINDQIYYSPFSTDQALRPSSKGARTPCRSARLTKKAASFGPADEAYYNANGSVISESRDEKTYQGLSIHPGSHSYETMSPSPQTGRSLISGNTTYSLVNDPDHSLYYSDIITGFHDFHADDNTYSDVEL